MKKIDFTGLYNNDDRQIMKWAEDSLNPRVDRVDEIIRYAKESGLKRIGLAHCIVFNQESEHLEKILQGAGFEVARVSCKYGRVPFDDLLPGYKGISCNPAGQAKYLEDEGTQLNIMMGLCLGHDMIFNARSKAPVTPLVVKDRKLQHNTLSNLQ
jgi:uncharacterized metal-binding protein